MLQFSNELLHDVYINVLANVARERFVVSRVHCLQFITHAIRYCVHSREMLYDIVDDDTGLFVVDWHAVAVAPVILQVLLVFYDLRNRHMSHEATKIGAVNEFIWFAGDVLWIDCDRL